MTEKVVEILSTDELSITEISGFSLIHIATRGNRKTAASGVKKAYGAGAPMKPHSVAGENGTLVMWFGPSSWIVRTTNVHDKLPNIELCSVTDISDSRRQIQLNGPRTVELLSTGCPVNFDGGMPLQGCAQTTYSQFQIFLHRAGEDSYDVFIPRSLYEDFEREISAAALVM